MEDLDLKELFSMFWTRKVYIVLIVLIFIVVGILYSYLYVTPQYKAYTTLLLATSSTEGSNTSSETITTTDITLNNNLVSTYSELIKSKTVLRQVIDNLSINRSEDLLKNNVSVNAVKSTQLIQINVVDKDPVEAKIIANEIAKVFTEKVSEFYNINNVHVVDKAEEPTNPYNINHTKDIMMFSFVGLVVACIYVLIANMLDTTVKNKEDVEKKLGLTVLVTIPACNFDELPKAMKKGGRR